MRLPVTAGELLQMLRWWRETGLGAEGIHLPTLATDELGVLVHFSPRELFLASAYVHVMPRWAAGRLVALTRAEGLDTRMGAPFTLPELAAWTEEELGYVDSANRLCSLLDALAESGVLVRDGPAFRYGTLPRPLGAEEQAFLDREFRGEVAFYAECLRRVPALFRGKDEPLGFGPESRELWDGILGGHAARFTRALALRLVHWNGKRVLDLGSGTGWSTEQLFRTHPDAGVTALDFTDAHHETVHRRVERLAGELKRGLDFTWIPAEKWRLGKYRGYGAPLPFEDGSFDGVFFPLNDPFIPRALAGFVYRDLARVLKPGGELLVASAPRPNGIKMRRELRAHLFFHEFCEHSVQGFQGLMPAPELLEHYAKAGLSAEHRFEGVVWRLVKA